MVWQIFFSLQPVKKPIANRFFGFLILMAAVTTVGTASAQESAQEFRAVTESEAVELLLRQQIHTERWEARVATSEADRIIAGAFPNPSLGYQREQLFSDPGQFEETIEIEQRLPVSGRRGLETRAARSISRATAADVRNEQRQMRRRTRELFYELLYRRRVVEIHEQSVLRLQESIEIMERRVDAGESSPYELERLRREEAEITATLDTQLAQLESERAAFASWLGFSPRDEAIIEARGRLLPDQLPAEQVVDDAIAAHPEIAAAEHRIDAFEFEGDAAARWWIPDLMLRGGFKREGHGDSQDLGVQFGISAAIPVFYRGQGHQDRARARTIQTRFQRQWIEQQITARALGLLRQTRRLAETTLTYREDSVDGARRVLELAEQAYEAGEAGLLELLDAHQSLLDARLREIDLSAQTRRTHIELRSLIELEEE